MLVKNPYRNYPRLKVEIIYSNGKTKVMRALGRKKMLFFPGKRSKILAIGAKMQNQGSVTHRKTMWIDGHWQDYDQQVLDQILADAQ
jgi:hypothetical protein